jgi:hypothetical protein
MPGDVVLYSLTAYFFFLFAPNRVQTLVEAGSNSSTVALRVVEGDEKGTQFLGVQLGHPLPGGNKYGDLALQVGGWKIAEELAV